MSSKIEWCDETWNPITGCTPISEGCENCYAARMAQRLRGRFGYPKHDPFCPGTEHQDRVFEQPTHWRKPRRIFVCSMGDLFHRDVRTQTIDRIFGLMTHPMSGMSHHTYLLLTKRPERLLEGHAERFAEWPNIWLGVTAENQQRADERIPILLEIPAAVRFVSVEPMLGPVDLSRYLGQVPEASHDTWLDYDPLNWVICGGETGPSARWMQSKWAGDLHDQCLAAGVPFFLKQWGAHVDVEVPNEWREFPK